MSRIGKKPIVLPKGTTVSLQDGVLKVVGPKGELTRNVRSNITFDINEKEVNVSPAKDDRFSQALWGTYASHLRNMVHGVNEGYSKQLIIEGIGYRAEVQGNKLVMNLGFSHPVEMDIPEGVSVTVEKKIFTISGINKEDVGQFAAVIRSKRKPEPYKGKGIRYIDEVIRRKEGKKVSVA